MVIRDDQIFYDVLVLALRRLKFSDEEINLIMTSDLDAVSNLDYLICQNEYSRDYILNIFYELKKYNKEKNLKYYFELLSNNDLKKVVKSNDSQIKLNYEKYIFNICSIMSYDDIITFTRFLNVKRFRTVQYDEEKCVMIYGPYTHCIYSIENSFDIINKMVNSDSKKINDFFDYYTLLLESKNKFNNKFCNLYFDVLYDIDFHDFIEKTINYLSYEQIKNIVLLDKRDGTDIRKKILTVSHKSQQMDLVCEKLESINYKKLEKSFDVEIYDNCEVLDYLNLIDNINKDNLNNILDYLNKKSLKSKDKKIKKLLKNVK